MQTIEQPTPQQLSTRKSNLQRKQRQRAREKARSDQEMVDHLESLKAERMNAEAIVRRIQRSQCMLGEVSPGVDARSVEEALEVAREMARALTVSDIQEGESLLDFERRIFEAWVNYDRFVGRNDAGGNFTFAGGGHAPYLNRETGELSPGHGKKYWSEHCGGFHEGWKALPGAKERVDLPSLPKLKKLKRPEESKPAPKAAPAPPLPAPIPSQQPTAIHFMYVPPEAPRYLNSNT
jgi:hypothetical protein